MSIAAYYNKDDDSDAYAMQLQLEDSQTHISDLLEMLAMENYAEESTQASSIINSMGTVLGKFSDNRFDFQTEMNAMLESSRRGMLTHAQLSELITAEANRSHHLNNILNSLKFQIENMHDALSDLRDTTELDDDGSQSELYETASQLTKKVALVMKSLTSMDRIVTAPIKKLPAAIACIDSEVVMHVNKTKLDGKSPINAGGKAEPKPGKPPSEGVGSSQNASPVPLTGDLAALDPSRTVGVAPNKPAVPVETKNFGCQVNLLPHSAGEDSHHRHTIRPIPDIAVELSHGGRSSHLTHTGSQHAAAAAVVTATSSDSAAMMIEQQERDGGHDAAIDLHCPSGGDDDNNSVNSAMTQDSKSHPPNLKAGATKHGKEKKHSSSSKKKVASTHSIKSHSTGKQRSADTHHSAEHVDVEQGGVGGASAQVKASDAHQRSAGSHPSLHPPLKGKGAPANLSVGIAVDPRSGSPALDQHLEFSDEMSDKVSSSSRASLNKDVLPSDSTAASAAGVSPSPRATHVDVAAKLDQGSLPSFPAAVELGDHMPITHTGSAAGSAAEDVVGMAAVRRLSQSELEEKMQSVVEQEVRRRVKLALTAAATKDYTGFANAIGSKSPSSRQTFAQYTGRPVSRDPFFPERAISSGEDTGGLDSSRPKLIQPESGNDFVVVPSGGAKKTVTIVEHHSSSSAAGEESWVGVVSSPVPLHVLPSVQSSQAKPGILQHPSMLSLDSNGSGPASISDPPSEPSVAVPISSVPAGYGLPAKMTVEHLIKDEALSVPSAHHAPVQVHEQHRQIIHTPPPNAPQPILVTPSTFAGSGSGQSFDVAIQGRGILLPESPGKNQVHHSPGGPSAPSESRPLGPMDHSSNVQGLGKFVLEGSNITANESDVARTRRRMEDARRRGGAEVIDDELSVQSNEFKRLLEAEAKTEKAKRATAGYAGASPTKVEIFNQIFQATKDPKKLELIKIQLPEAAGKPVEHTFSDDKSASQQLHANPVTAQGSAAEPAREPADPHASWIELSASDIILPGKVPPGHAENSIGGALHATKVARAFKEAEINAIKSALSKALESDTYCYLISQLDKLFARCNSIASQNAPPAELPIYDNQGGILLTRTYRAQTPPTTFEEILSSSDNPLLCLHQQYCSYLSKTHRLRLLNAAVMEDRLKTDMPQSKSVHQLLGLLLESVLTLVKDCNEMLSLMDACEDRVGTMVELLRRKPDYLSVVAANPRMAELYGFFGQIESIKLCVDLKLVEFRSIFERINAQSMHEIQNLMKESADFEYCYKHFLACQGKSVELNQRLTMCKDRCVRYNLGTNSTEKKKVRAKIEFDDQTSLGMGGPEGHLLELKDMRAEIEDLQEQLLTAKEEYEDQEVEMLELLQERDRSPDALLFFAIMHDPSYLTNLQQMILQLRHLKSFADGTGHMDFMTLRKRVQVCVVLVPSVEKLVDRYSAMYQKWSAFRLNWFSARKLNGGSADAFNSCPLCFQCVTPDGDGDATSKKVKSLAVTGMDRMALQRQNKQMRQSSSLKQLKQSRTPAVGLDEMSTISSPERHGRINFTLPNIK